MLRLFDIPRAWGPLVTVIFTVIYHLLAMFFGFSIAVMPLTVFLAAGTFIGGLRAGLICALWISLYAYLFIPDSTRVIQIAIGCLGLAIIIGWLRRRERQLENISRAILANGNIQKINEARQIALELKLSLNGPAKKMVEKIDDKLGNTLAVLEGYKFLRDEIDRVNEWYSIPGNAKKLQEMLEENALSKENV